MVVSERDRILLDLVAQGLPLAPRPFAALGLALGMSEEEVIARVKLLQDSGTIKRLGVVVRHHELGYRANAMVVWDVPDADVSDLGRRMAATSCVTLCYRRPRRLPVWPYNLFCMIHGRDRATVASQVEALADELGAAHLPRAVLFSRRRFKQRGARYGAAPATPATGRLVPA